MTESSPSALLPPEEHVLSTLEADGSRRWLTPRLSKGRFWRRRRVVAYVLLALYSLLPWIEVGGEQAVLLDVPARRFTFFGATFLPTDTTLLALTGLALFVAIFLATALVGRIWCGWVCPQTVYMEFVFRPIERLFTGRAGKGGRPRTRPAGWKRVGMYVVYVVICVHLAQTFVAYFAGADSVRQWIWGSPLAHPVAFLVVVALTVAMMVDFAFWREQLCIIGCPYGRFQSVLLDRASKIVAYDHGRGEPRRKGKQREGAGDCVDCGMCVAVCPTGIDIRDGLQLECVNCTQCMDACDEVMDRVGKPRGLVRYSSQAADEGERVPLLRPRVAVYAVVLLALTATLGVQLAGKPAADVVLLRALGRPFVVVEDGRIDNTMRLKLTNRTDGERSYDVEIVEPEGLEVLLTADRVTLAPGATVTEPAHVLAPWEAFERGRLDAVLRVTDDQGWSEDVEWRLLGPTGNPKEDRR